MIKTIGIIICFEHWMWSCWHQLDAKIIQYKHFIFSKIAEWIILKEKLKQENLASFTFYVNENTAKFYKSMSFNFKTCSWTWNLRSVIIAITVKNVPTSARYNSLTYFPRHGGTCYDRWSPIHRSNSASAALIWRSTCVAVIMKPRRH